MEKYLTQWAYRILIQLLKFATVYQYIMYQYLAKFYIPIFFIRHFGTFSRTKIPQIWDQYFVSVLAKIVLWFLT